MKKNHWFWQIGIGLGFIGLTIILSSTNIGSDITNSGQWFWMSFTAMILNSVYFISFQFFGGPKYKLEPSIQHMCFSLGTGLGMTFVGTTLRMISLESYTNFVPVAIVAVMGLILTGAPSNLMTSMAVRTKGISPSLPFVVAGGSNFLMYVLAAAMAVAAPTYFKQANWNIWSASSLVAIIVGLVVVKIYGLPVKDECSLTLATEIKSASNNKSKGVREWLLEGNWFSKSFSAMLVITVYLVSFQFFSKSFKLDPVVQHSVYLTFMGIGIFMYSKLLKLFPAEEYKKYVPMGMVFLMGLTIGAWLNNLVTISLRTPGLNPGLPFVVANTFQVTVYIVGHWLALRFNQFNRTVFNWQTGISITVVLAALLIIKLFA